MKRILLILLTCLTNIAYAEWETDIAPYLWASSLKGTQQVREFTFKVSEPFSQLIKELDFGTMLWIAVHDNNFGVFFNGVYSKVSDKLILDNIDIRTSSILTIDSAGVSYKLRSSPADRFYFEPYAGARYTLNNNKVSIGEINANQKNDWTDGIFGTRVIYNFSSSFDIQGSADYGLGTHSNSYNLSALLGYQSQTHFKCARFYLGYRFLHQNFHRGEGVTFYRWNMNVFGPVLGVLFHF